MSYEKYYPGGWQSGETGGTPITPEALNHMENGIVNAAPAGFGYGETLPEYTAGTEAEMETNLLRIINGMPNYTTKQVRGILSFLGVTTYYLTTIYRHTTTFALVTFHTMRFGGAVLQKSYTSGAWGPLEWYNPPMMDNTEYATVERWEGKTVYRKRVVYTNPETVGDASGISAIYITHGVSNLGAIIRYNGKTGEYPLPYVSTSGGTTTVTGYTSLYIEVRMVNAQWASRKWVLDIAYTKST